MFEPIETNFELYENDELSEASISIYKLIRMVIKKEIIVPRFIRPIVWGKERAREFIRFLFKGLPYGDFTLWELSSENPNTKYYRTILKSAYQLPDHVNLILDGLQRCTVISAIFSREEVIINKEFQDLDLYYNLVTDRFKFKKEIKKLSNNWINLKETCNLYGDNSKQKEIFMKKFKPVLDRLSPDYLEIYDIVKKRIDRIFGLVNKIIKIDVYRGLSSNFALDIIKNRNMSVNKVEFKFS